MVTKIAAGCLIVLVISPFTAPFSTCDLGVLLGVLADHAAPFAPRSANALITQTPASIVPGARVAEQVRRVTRSTRATLNVGAFVFAASSRQSIDDTDIGSS